MKNLCFFINTPGQVHSWRFLIYELINKGYRVKILARQYRHTLALLDRYELEYTVYLVSPKSSYLKPVSFFAHLPKAYKLCRQFDADIVVGFGLDASLVGWLLHKPCIVFSDYEDIPLQHFVTKLFASVILTPECFAKNLGKKHIRVAGYKELAYLHPNHFISDPSIYQELGIGSDTKYVVLRFNASDAVHDISFRGFSTLDKYRLVEELSKYARVFVSTAGDLPKDLEVYRLPIHPSRIHHALCYAQMLVCDTRTMAWEAAVLGTPTITCGSFAGQMGNLTELEQKYGLLYTFREPDQASGKALELIQQDDVKEKWAEKRNRLLQDKIDVTDFMVWFIENYPHSFEECRRKQVRAME